MPIDRRKLLDPARGPEMTRADWARFAAAYAVYVVATALFALLFNGFLAGFRHYRGIPTFALVFAPFAPLAVAFGERSAPPRRAVYVVKVVLALAILGAVTIGIVEAFTSWDGGLRLAASSAAMGAILVPLMQIAVRADQQVRARRKAAAQGVTTPPAAG